MITEKTIETLKPCPFCGCKDILDGYIRDGREIVCGECRASIAAFHPDASKRAAERWNRRSEAALSTDAEPVAWYWVDLNGRKHVSEHEPPVMHGTFLKEKTPIYEAPPQPAPSVAVKALEWSRTITDYGHSLKAYDPFGRQAYHIRVEDSTTEEDIAKAKAEKQADYDTRIRAALSAQLQDVAEVMHEDICNTHDGGPCNCDWSAAAPAAKQEEKDNG